MRLEHSGVAHIARSTALLGATALDLVIAGDDLTNWPTGSVGPFYVSMNKGTLTEEKILCSGRVGLNLQVWTDGATTGRGADGTVAQTHAVNSTIEHVWTAAEADAANVHLNDSTTDVHPQYIAKAFIDAKGDLIVGSADGTVVRLPVGANGDSLVADSTASGGVKWGAATATLSPFLLMGA